MRGIIGVVIVGLLAFSVACVEPDGLSTHRDRLERQLLERQVILADLALFRSGVEALARRRAALRAQLGQVNVRLLAQGLREESATGRLERREGAPDVVIMTGPGPADRAAFAMEQAALRAPGLRVMSLKVDEARWTLRCEIDNDLPAPAPDRPAALKQPPWWQRGALWDEVVRLQAAIALADTQIGVNIESLGQQQWEVELLQARFEAPSRLRQVTAVVNGLLAGEQPLATQLELSFEGNRGEGYARPVGNKRAADLGLISGVTVTDRQDGMLQLTIDG